MAWSRVPVARHGLILRQDGATSCVMLQRDILSRIEKHKNVFVVTNGVVIRDFEVLRWAIDAESQDLAI